jgi:hypothetical protein
MRNSRFLNLAFAAFFLAGTLASVAGTLIDVAFTDGSSTEKTGLAATGVSTNDFWNTCAATNPPNGYGLVSGGVSNLEFVDGTASGAGLTVANAIGAYSDGASDPMYGTYLYNQWDNITVAVRNLSAGVYAFYLYGHGNEDDQNSIFQLTVGSLSYGTEATTNGSGWLSSVWQEWVQYVEFTNVIASAGQTIIITVEPGVSGYAVLSGLQIAAFTLTNAPAFIVTQPANQAIIQGATATFSVLAAGAALFAYQWLFNNTNIAAATNSSYTVTNAQPTNAGNYLVSVSNQYGTVTSLTVALNVIFEPVTNVIDVAFTSGSLTAEKGFAATGVSPNDFWNTCILDVNTYYGSLPNLEFEDGTASGAGLTVYNPVGANTDAASDPMYATYLFSDYDHSYPYISVTVTNLNAGLYDFYLYGHGNEDNQNSFFQLTVDSLSYGSEATTNGPGWLSSFWQEGVQYVEFSNVIVSAGQTIAITVEPGASPYAVLSGLQMAFILRTNSPPLIINAANQFVNANQRVVITNYAYSANAPISFSLDPSDPAGASISAEGIFKWTPTCEQGSSTNLITVWATDSSSPPLSNSMTFTVTVGECVEVSIGSSAVQAGQGTGLPVNLVASVGLTNLSFTLAYPSGFLTNWNISPSNSAIASATANTVDPSHTQFNIGSQGGQVLQGVALLGSISLDALPGPSAFVPLALANISVEAANNSAVTNLIAQVGRVVVIGAQPLLESAIGANSSRTLTLYGNPGVNYDLLSTTNIANTNSWSTVGSVTMSQLVQSVSLGSATNPVQFFQAVAKP